MQEQSNSFLATQPIGSLMRRYAIPCIISLLVAALYNMAAPGSPWPPPWRGRWST